MLSSHILLAVLGLMFGSAVSAGTFAFLMVIGITPRMAAKCHGANHMLWFENAIILGGIIGNLYSVFLQFRLPFGSVILALFGISAGIFVGCISVALAEILNTFPIMFRRFKVKIGLAWVLYGMALGKALGSAYYFINSMDVS